ncbi:hypothetical protein [Flavobacterium branchiicola]|uniref:TonB C-terminal domain-containing protein n=1 Tax=Flavobacterium branchiicola TaxID=1114875 RepID=A0ABV9P734_9FLAO|nr:hypothetical protein [Flavobacterium branchiicola]MBS7252802.1 hypothetical protein [Flavobacterium branchiicola]
MEFKITIPEPCHENWDKMTPKENGRFCLSCSKTVIDFTKMLPEEIQHYFIQNRNEKICGRFKKSQLNTINIQIPNRVLYSQTHYHKMFLLALFIAMGTTLFSCQDKDGNKQKIDTIEVVEDSKQNENAKQIPPPPAPPLKQDNQDYHKKSTQRTTGEVILENQTNSVNKTKKNKLKFNVASTNCEKTTYRNHKSSSKINGRKTIVQDSIVKEEDIYVTGAAIETKADYPNGINAFYAFFAQEFKRPEKVENSKDRILVSFVIEKDGALTSIEFPKNIDSQLKSEITRVLKLSPRWIPSEQNGKKTRTKYSFPIFLENEDKS